MIAAAALALVMQLAPAPPAVTAPPPPLAEWPALPPYPLPRGASTADGVGFVREEVEAERCRPQLPPANGDRLQLPVAILVGEGGQVRRIVPQAIGCSSVEQYVVGYLLSLTRSGTGAAPTPLPGWYQLTVGYRW